jgi:Rab5 GDP/GTP exchange factor
VATTTPLSPRPDIDLTAESDAQAVVSGTTFPEATKAFFQRSSEVAQRTVSRPLNAISKILSELGEPEQPVPSPSAVPPPVVEYAPSYQTRRPRQPRQRSQPSPSATLLPQQSSYPASANVEPGDYLPDSADVAASIAQATEAQQRAALGTLKSMFPDIDEDVLEIVLLSSKGEISAAIDRLLDMS